MSKTLFTALALALAAVCASTTTVSAATATLLSFEVSMRDSENKVGVSDFDQILLPGPEVTVTGPLGGTTAWLFDMIDGNTFSLTWRPNIATGRPSLNVYIADLRYDGFPNPGDPTSLQVIGGTAQDVTDINVDAVPNAFGEPAMQFNIAAKGTFGDLIPSATWTFRYTTDIAPGIAPVPLPAGLPLAATGLGALAWLRRRKG